MLTDSAKKYKFKYKYPPVDKLFDSRLAFCWFIISDESLSMNDWAARRYEVGRGAKWYEREAAETLEHSMIQMIMTSR